MTNTDKARYLLCRPQGGLNDMFCQIEKCWQYADKFKRCLIVETCQSVFGNHFSNFFTPISSEARVLFSMSRELAEELDNLSCFPRCVEGRVNAYETKHLPSKNFVERESFQSLTFDLSKDYEEELLVHQQCGGGEHSFKLLCRVKFSESVLSAVNAGLRNLPAVYDSVHVRNTDYKTDFGLFMKKLESLVKSPVLICSDNSQVISYAHDRFGANNVITINDIGSKEGRPLHQLSTNKSLEELSKATIVSFVDLLALSGSRAFFYTDVSGGFPSGFSMLAAFLFENQGVRRKLLDNDGDKIIAAKTKAVYLVSPARKLRRSAGKVVQIIRKMFF